MSIKHGKIGEFAKRVKVGFVGTCEKYYTEDKRYPMIRTTNLTETGIDYSDLKYVTEEFYDKNKKSQLHDGDVLIARFGTSGTACVYHGGDAQCLNAIIVEPNIETTIPEYLAIVVNSRSVRDQVNKRIVGSTQAILNTKVLSDIEIGLPSLEEQRKVVEIFQSIQKICIQRNEELLILDKLIKARFVELFGDPKINEKNWDTGIVSQFYEVKGGKRIPKGMGYADGITAHPYLRATDMKNETILDDDIHYIDEEVFEKIKRYTVKGGDIYLTNVGVNLGMAGVIPDKYDGANLTENAVKLVPKTEAVLDGLFLSHYINSPGIQDYINERKMSVGVPKLAIFRIETMPLILPPIDLQIEFIDFCKQVDKSKVVVQKALEETRKLFDSLMQDYFG